MALRHRGSHASGCKAWLLVPGVLLEAKELRAPVSLKRTLRRLVAARAESNDYTCSDAQVSRSRTEPFFPALTGTPSAVRARTSACTLQPKLWVVELVRIPPGGCEPCP